MVEWWHVCTVRLGNMDTEKNTPGMITMRPFEASTRLAITARPSQALPSRPDVSTRSTPSLAVGMDNYYVGRPSQGLFQPIDMPCACRIRFTGRQEPGWGRPENGNSTTSPWPKRSSAKCSRATARKVRIAVNSTQGFKILCQQVEITKYLVLVPAASVRTCILYCTAMSTRKCQRQMMEIKPLNRGRRSKTEGKTNKRRTGHYHFDAGSKPNDAAESFGSPWKRLQLQRLQEPRTLQPA